MKCKHCGTDFLRVRPDANSQNHCSMKCRLLSGYKESESGCWEWQRALFKTGYGAIRFNGKTMTAHRASYREFVGPLVDGMYIIHKCDNRKCMNPAHLLQGTPRDNTADMISKKRDHWTNWSDEEKRAWVKKVVSAQVHDGSKPKWANDPIKVSAAVRKAWETRRLKYGRSGGNSKRIS